MKCETNFGTYGACGGSAPYQDRCHDKCADDDTVEIRVGILEMKKGLQEICDCRERDGTIDILAGIRDVDNGLRNSAAHRSCGSQKGLDCCLLGVSEVSGGLMAVLENCKNDGIIEIYRGIRHCEEGSGEICRT